MLKKTILFISATLIVIFLFNSNKATELLYSKFICPLPRQAGNNDLHSQYLEDYVLSMVLSNIAQGTYIDVGANNPDKDSVTKYFYLRGWRGINIEPIEKWYNAFLVKRPDDINLNYGISNKEGNLKFYRILHKDHESVDGLSTFDEKFLETAIKDGFEYETSIVSLKTMNQVFSAHPLKSITFMKIDVEGFEKQVLEGMDLRYYRPNIFIIEATEPRYSDIPTYEQWESILINNNYRFVMFDGINRFYLASEYYDNFINKFKKAYKCAHIQNKVYNVIDSKIFFNN